MEYGKSHTQKMNRFKNNNTSRIVGKTNNNNTKKIDTSTEEEITHHKYPTRNTTWIKNRLSKQNDLITLTSYSYASNRVEDKQRHTNDSNCFYLHNIKQSDKLNSLSDSSLGSDSEFHDDNNNNNNNIVNGLSKRILTIAPVNQNGL